VETCAERNVGLMLGENAVALVYHSTILNLSRHLRGSRRSNGTCLYRPRLVLVRGHRSRTGISTRVIIVSRVAKMLLRQTHA
jgi:hypothetical protein